MTTDPADDRCPPGHRLLMQLVDATAPDEARHDLVRIFGPAKGAAAVLVPGTRQQPVGALHSSWGLEPCVWHATGYRAYLPLERRHNHAGR